MVEHEYIFSSSLNGELLLFRTLWNNSSDNMFVVSIDSDGDFVNEASNNALKKTFNFQTDGAKLKDILDAKTFKTISDTYNKCIVLNKPITYNESAVIDNTGERYWNTTILPVIDENGKNIRIFGISREFTPLKNAEKKLQIINTKLDEEVRIRTKELEEANIQLKFLATMDELTQLPNRRYFEEYFQNNWKIAKQNAMSISLVMCDVDYFKKINDAHGHIVGDMVLKEIAKAIQISYPKKLDFVARYGGEEFIIVLCDTSLDVVSQICINIQDNIRNIHKKSFQNINLNQITMSLGISSTIPKDDDSEKLLRYADNALYEAKNSGRDCIITSFV